MSQHNPTYAAALTARRVSFMTSNGQLKNVRRALDRRERAGPSLDKIESTPAGTSSWFPDITGLE